MHTYISTKGLLAGSSWRELQYNARKEYRAIQKRTPRRIAYVRSIYFKKDKIFINNFWDHLNQKPPREKLRRLRYYKCGIDLLRNNSFPSDSFQNPENANEMLHRFYGISKDGYRFVVQVKDNKKTNRKDFISVFPSK